MSKNLFDERAGAPIKDIYTVEEAATLMHVNVSSVYRMAKEGTDPFPIRRMESKKRGGIVMRDEMRQWIERNIPVLYEYYQA